MEEPKEHTKPVRERNRGSLKESELSGGHTETLFTTDTQASTALQCSQGESHTAHGTILTKVGWEHLQRKQNL